MARPQEQFDIGGAAESVRRDGFVIVRSVADRALIDELLRDLPPVPAAGTRNLLSLAPTFRKLTCDRRLESLLTTILGKPGFITRSILFDKSPGANWALGFHQDVAIAVAERVEVPAFGPWSVKEGVPHVRPPSAVLEQMITVRVHLDDCGPDNGPLAVIPGSHSRGMLDDAALRPAISAGPVLECTVKAGDAVLMRPLLLHGSRKAEKPAHRRVAHFEIACDPLPHPLRWHEERRFGGLPTRDEMHDRPSLWSWPRTARD